MAPLLHTALDGLFATLTLAAPPVCAAVPLVLWRRGDRPRAAGALGAALVAAVLVSVLLQFALMRARPDGAVLFAAAPTPAFPSGHAAMVFALAVFGTLMWPRRGVGLFAFALLVGASRVYLRHHFVSDVVVGGVIGGAIGALAYGTYVAAPSARPRWAWWLWPQLAVVVFASAAAYLRLSDFGVLRVPGVDKGLHFLLFGLLAFFTVAWLAPRPWARVTAGLALLATADEVAQAWFPMRTFDLVDLVCTLSGIGLAGALAGQLTRRSATLSATADTSTASG